jgi:hypothetical protein
VAFASGVVLNAASFLIDTADGVSLSYDTLEVLFQKIEDGAYAVLSVILTPLFWGTFSFLQSSNSVQESRLIPLVIRLTTRTVSVELDIISRHSLPKELRDKVVELLLAIIR